MFWKKRFITLLHFAGAPGAEYCNSKSTESGAAETINVKFLLRQ
jgi:hypothetical protein